MSIALDLYKQRFSEIEFWKHHLAEKHRQLWIIFKYYWKILDIWGIKHFVYS